MRVTVFNRAPRKVGCMVDGVHLVVPPESGGEPGTLQVSKREADALLKLYSDCLTTDRSVAYGKDPMLAAVSERMPLIAKLSKAELVGVLKWLANSETPVPDVSAVTRDDLVSHIVRLTK